MIGGKKKNIGSRFDRVGGGGGVVNGICSCLGREETRRKKIKPLTLMAVQLVASFVESSHTSITHTHTCIRVYFVGPKDRNMIGRKIYEKIY